MKTRLSVLVGILFCLAVSPSSHAQIPRTLSYQGVLTDNAGKPMPDGSYNFTFRLYTSPTGGTAIWSETKDLRVKSGLFSTALGDTTSFGAAVKFDQQYWLSIQVGSDPELSPRIALTSVGYSFSSLRADTASVSVASLADTTWRHSGANIYRFDGNVGIGAVNPAGKLDVRTVDNSDVNIAIQAGVSTRWWMSGDNSTNRFLIGGTGANRPDDINFPIIVAPNGNVGIGTLNPDGKLDVRTVDNSDVNMAMQAGVSTRWWMSGDNSTNRFLIGGNGANRPDDINFPIIVAPNGNVGLGTLNPDGKLDVRTADNSDVNIVMQSGVSTKWWMSGDNSTNRFLIGGNGANRPDDINFPIAVAPDGNIGIGTTSPASKLEVVGTTTTKVLKITGGGDLAEPFEISESQPIPKGALVIIDEDNPGQLKLSHQAYDKRVAGVVSGAGGINPGITLTQEGMLEGGQNVALSGRVYALATAANGPIKPGDLLTTSEVPGHAMKATDFVRWQGAVIGKAMSSLENGEGLVLVLVNLQ